MPSLAVNRGQQDRLVLRVEADVRRQFETLRRVDGGNGLQQPIEAWDCLGPIRGQIPAGFIDCVSRAQQLDVFKAPESGQSRELHVSSGIHDVSVEEDRVQRKGVQ